MSITETPFRPLAWQQSSWDQLQGVVSSGRAPHALLLEGEGGTGRHQFARAFAARLLCEKPVEAGACGKCRSCELLAAGTHADCLVVEPLEAGKSIGIDAIRDALRFLAATPSLGARKVLTVAPAEKMTTAAFNAFLKGLEEPPPGTTILLVTARGYPIPATIRSRCQRLGLGDPSAADALTWISAQAARSEISLSDAATEKIISLVPGRPLLAVELLRDGSSDHLVALADLMRGMAASPSRERANIRAAIISHAGQIEILPFLDLAERFIARFLRECSPAQLRSSSGRAAFRALNDIALQRSAVQAGTNPNPDLLRHRTIEHFLDAVAA